jgi:hypothetical protein
MDTSDALKIDKTVMEISSLTDRSSDRAYWHSVSPEERLSALETLRRLNYGESACTARLQRVLEVVERPWG